jgi:hypothetical protein
MFGPKLDGVTGSWRQLHNGKLNNLCSFPNIVRLIKLKGMGWDRHVACIGVMVNEKVSKFWLENVKGRNHLDGVCGRTIFK